MALEQPFQLLQPKNPLVPSYSVLAPEHIQLMQAQTNSSCSPTNPSSSSPPPFTPISDSTSLPSAPPTASSFQLPSSVSLDSQIISNSVDLDNTAPTSTNPQQDVDSQILEALKSKDRIYVLQMGEVMEGLIKDKRARIDLMPSTSYQRMLVHRCSAFYKLLPTSDHASKSITVLATPESRIPIRRLCDLVPAEAITQPAFKIMRRSPPDRDRRPNKTQSQTGSVAGEDADLSDVEPSESGSLGGRSNATGGSNKKRMTIEEREAAYNEARSRIFMDFEEKDKDKGKDMSASSSSLSLVSGSGGGGGSSVTGELDEIASSPATESEYSGPSGPIVREKKDVRHVTRNASSSSSSRSLRSSAPPYNGGQGSSRNSRAPSPSFTYATIYEPTQGTVYDPSQPPPPPHGYHPPQYMYPYSPPPGQPPNAYFGGYPYYPPYPYQSPPPVQHSISDPSTPSSSEPYASPQPGGYASHHYGWPPPHLQSPPAHMQVQPPPPPPPPPQGLSHPTAPPIHGPHYSPYMLPPHQPYAYPVAPYYQTQPGQHVEPPPPPPPHVQHNMYEMPRSLNGGVMGNPAHNNSAPSIVRSGISTHTGSSTNGRSPSRHNGANGTKARGIPPMSDGRTPAWSYGPGVSQGGHISSLGSVGGDAIGPRLSNTRKTSNNSAASSVNSRSSNCDDVSSTASSSTTSSSSRRTYTSGTSSQHPLPLRPDWAVGLKPQPTLHPTYGQSRHHDHSHANSRTMSPISAPRSLNGNSGHSNNNNHALSSQQKQPVPLQSSADFPPLSSVSVAPEKRMPIASGAWGNNTSSRNIRLPSPAQPNAGVPIHHPTSAPYIASEHSETRLEYSDHGFERPPPKSAELYNPKVFRRNTQGKGQPEKERERSRSDLVASSVLVGQVEAMTLGTDAETSSSAQSQPASSPKEPS